MANGGFGVRSSERRADHLKSQTPAGVQWVLLSMLRYFFPSILRGQAVLHVRQCRRCVDGLSPTRDQGGAPPVAHSSARRERLLASYVLVP